MRHAGRRPGATETRDEIVSAARRLFAEKGYDGTTIRGIAAAASVNPALVHHFFGTKQQVFVAALDFPFTPADVLHRCGHASATYRVASREVRPARRFPPS